MGKQRVSCPHCTVSLNVNEELLGKTVKCPGCKQQMQLPNPEDLSPTPIAPEPDLPFWADQASPSIPDHIAAAVQRNEGTDPPESFGPPAIPLSRQTQAIVDGPLEIKERPALQFLSSVFRYVGFLMMIIGGVGLFLQIYLAITYEAGTDTGPSLGVALSGGGMIFGGIVYIAAAELVKVLVSMEQAQRLTVNELRLLRRS